MQPISNSFKLLLELLPFWMVRSQSVLQLLKRVLLKHFCVNRKWTLDDVEISCSSQNILFVLSIITTSGFWYSVASNLKAIEVAHKERNCTFNHFSMENGVGFFFSLAGICNSAIKKQVSHFWSRVTWNTMWSFITRFSFSPRPARGSWKARRARGSSRTPSHFFTQKACTAIPFFT